MRHRVRALTAVVIVVLGSLAVGAPAGAVTGSFDASCQVMGTAAPPPDIRTFGYEAHAPESVAAGATFAVPVSIGYTVPPNANAGIALFAITGATTGSPGFTVPGGESSIHGTLGLSATGPVGGAVVVAVDKFGALVQIGDRAISEVCTPLHRTVVASVPIGVPSVSIGDAAVVEGASGTRALVLPVTLSRPASTNVTVGFTTEDGTASAGADYVATSGSVTIFAGTVSGVARVRVRGDGAVEPKENFRVRLHDAVGAALGRSVGTGRIIDDDPASGPRLSIGDVGIVEGVRGTRSPHFTISMSAPATERVTFHIETADGSATAGSDYRTSAFEGFINPGSVSTTLPVPVVADGVVEPNETFTVRLAGVTGATVGRGTGVGTIIDDD